MEFLSRPRCAGFAGYGEGGKVALAKLGLPSASLVAIGVGFQARAQPAASEPPVVGVIETTNRSIMQSNEFLGRISAISRPSTS
jgi:membrane fusion protein (multidrug efflux system)